MDETATPTIKERLTARFVDLRNSIGPDWRKQLAKSDPFFDTKKGSDYMVQVSGAPTQSRRVSNDRLERVVLALEKIVPQSTQAHEAVN